MKYLGIDYGTKRIGLAVSDDEGRLAFPLRVLEAGRDALSEVAKVAAENSVGTIVLGESRNFAGKPNVVQEDIEQFKKDLGELVHLPVVYHAEFFTSTQAMRQVQNKRLDMTGELKNIDASAAAIVLQSYLDQHVRKN